MPAWRRYAYLLSATCLAAALVAPAGGQAVELNPRTRARLERLAAGDARGRLVDAVWALSLRDSQQTLGDWAAQTPALAQALRVWVRSTPSAWPTRYYRDGVAEVDLRLDADALRQQLLVLQADIPPETPLTSQFLQVRARQWPAIWATGRGDVETRALGVDVPLGWERVTKQGVEVARKAARDAAIDALLAEAATLHVGSERLRAFFDSSPAVRDAVRTRLTSAADLVDDFDTDRVAFARATLPLPQLIGILTAVQREYAPDSDFTSGVFRQMALDARIDALEAVGLAEPEPRYVAAEPVLTTEHDVPAWARRTLTATGRYVPDPRVGLLDTAAQIEAARALALDALRQQVEHDLVLQRRLRVGEFLADRRELKTDVTTFLSGARVVEVAAPAADGSREVRVELPLRRLWEIVRQGMQKREVAPGSVGVANPSSNEA